MDALCDAFNAFAALDRQHPDELRDFADGVHRCQDQLALRVCRRAYPKGWPAGGEPSSEHVATAKILADLLVGQGLKAGRGDA